jgi:hypothetical protein
MREIYKCDLDIPIKILKILVLKVLNVNMLYVQNNIFLLDGILFIRNILYVFVLLIYLLACLCPKEE